jgi:hypothetical protein
MWINVKNILKWSKYHRGYKLVKLDKQLQETHILNVVITHDYDLL